MTPLEKALWYIDRHFESPLTLDAIAACAGVSRFHLLRAFAAATGLSPMRHDQRFDPLSGHGGIELWVPLA